MRLTLISINHRTAPVELREKLALPPQTLAQRLPRMREACGSDELAVLATCNRVELYAARPRPADVTADKLRTALAEQFGLTGETLAPVALLREQTEAVRHLFRVAAGLESMVLGEDQVLSQVKRAYDLATGAHTVGPVLHQVFQQAIATARRVRRETAVGSGRLSVGSVAINFARQVFEHFEDKTVACLGAGELIKATLPHVAALRPGRLCLLNRSPERAIALRTSACLRDVNAQARPWDELDNLLVEADLILSCTGSPEPIVTAERFRAVRKRRRNRPLVILDVALPRDFDPALGQAANVYLYNLDDLQEVVRANLGQRSDAVDDAGRLVNHAVDRCVQQLYHRDVGQLVRRLREWLHDIGRIENDRTARKLAALANGDPQQAQALAQLLDQHTHRLVNKLLHLPLQRLDDKDEDAPLGFYAAALRELFDLSPDTPQADDATTQREPTDDAPSR